MKDLNFAPSRLRVNELLEQHFDTAFAAPDGIKKLRELILTLAMQGKLVAQDPNDPPASQLLKEIEAEKKRLVKEGKIRAPKPLPEIKPEEVPYALPQGWEWVRLGTIASKITDGDHKTPPRISEGLRLLSAKNVRDGYLDFDNCDLISEQHYLKSRERCCPDVGDLLIVSVGGTIGRTSLVPDDSEFALVRSVALIKPLLFDSAYLKRSMDSTLLQNSIHTRKRGGAQPCLYLSEIEQFIFSLPPLPEQHRIVTKIDQLMARCDELEKLRDERERKRRSVHAAAIKQLLEESSSPSFASSRLRVSNFFNHFDELYTVKENVTELRKAILQLAVMGKLVPQNPNDPPASQLLKEIAAEKKRLVKEGKIKAPKPLPEIKPEEVPYALPQGWEWVRLGDIGISQTGTTPPSKDAENLGDFIPFIGPGDIKNNVINYSGEGLSEIGLSNGRLIEKGSVLMVCIGGSIGKHAVNDRDITCNQQINTLTPYKPVSVNFVFYSMGAEWFQNNVVAQAGGSATPIINKQKWSSILVPLPPTFEQHQIVAKIDSLMALCDTLEQQIDAATSKQTALLDAVMAQV